MKFMILSDLNGAVGCGYRWKHCSKPVWEAWRNIRKNIFFVKFIFRECTAAIIPIVGSKKPSFSSKIKGFTIGNPIENQGKSLDFPKNPKIKIFKVLRTIRKTLGPSGFPSGIDYYTHKRSIAQKKSALRKVRGAHRPR